jgi:tetratricopeptide (TPR) repeat protein
MKSPFDLFCCGGKPRKEPDPLDPKTWYNKGVEMLNWGNFDEAEGCFDKALELDSKDAKSWNNKGISLLYLSRFDDAVECIDRAIELDPNHAFYWYNKGICHEHLHHLEMALESFEKAIELYPKYAEAWYNRAVAAEALATEASGDKQAAIKAWQSYLKIVADNRKQKDWIYEAQERLRKLEQK